MAFLGVRDQRVPRGNRDSVPEGVRRREKLILCNFRVVVGKKGPCRSRMDRYSPLAAVAVVVVLVAAVFILGHHPQTPTPTKRLGASPKKMVHRWFFKRQITHVLPNTNVPKTPDVPRISRVSFSYPPLNYFSMDHNLFVFLNEQGIDVPSPTMFSIKPSRKFITHIFVFVSFVQVSGI
jgi:hypothetical protein